MFRAWLWGFLWQKEVGLVNIILVDWLHILHDKPSWLIGSNTLWAIVRPTIWRQWPFSMLMLLAGLQGISKDVYEAAEIDGVKFYNDSKATNVDSTIKALEAFERGVIIILGGKDKGGDYAPLALLVQERCEQVILIGAAADKIAAALENTKPLHRATTMENAVSLGKKLAQKGDTVLLAPACASFDMFDNYEHRGRVFKAAVLHNTEN